MRKLLLVMFGLLLLLGTSTNAQNIPSTSGANICQCLPAGWNTAIGSGNYTANRTYWGSVQVAYTPTLPPIPSGANTFIGLHGGIVSATITGLTVGKKYKFYYSVISAQTNYVIGGEDHSQYFSNQVEFRIIQLGGVVTTHTHFFSKESDNGKWRTSQLEFTSKATTAVIDFEDAGGNQPGFVGLDLTANSVVPCNAGVNQVGITKPTAEILCPATQLNLVTEFFGGLIPSGASLRYFDNPTHSGLPLNNVNVGPGTYYAFYFDESNSCYNTDYSNAKMEVTYKECADLAPTVDIDGLNFVNGATRDFVVNLYEVNSRQTTGNVSFRLTKLGNFTITYPTASGSSNVYGGIQNENSKWTFSETGNFITVTSSTPIPPLGQAVIGFSIARKPGTPKGTQNITPTILTNSGGEINPKNNSSVTSISTN